MLTLPVCRDRGILSRRRIGQGVRQPSFEVACAASPFARTHLEPRSHSVRRSGNRQKKQECPKPLRITGMLGCHLDCLNVLSLPTLWPLGHVELDRLTLLQTAEASCLNSGEM